MLCQYLVSCIDDDADAGGAAASFPPMMFTKFQRQVQP
jgi:hypothetical protein